MQYKTVQIKIELVIPETDCLAIEEIGDELYPILSPYGILTGISYGETKAK